MGIQKGITIGLVISLLLLSVASDAMAGDPFKRNDIPAEAMIFDLFVAKPLGVVATAIGTGVFILSLPVSTMGGNAKEAGEKLVAEPVRFTFTRPLGDFSGDESREGNR